MAPGPVVPAWAAAPPERWRSLRGLRTALTVLFICLAASYGLLAVALANRISVVSDVDTAAELVGMLDTFQDADDLVAATSALSLVLTLAVAVCFIVWMYRAARNNEALGRVGSRLGPGWAIGGWFVPFANLVLPIRQLQDLWRGSDPRVARDDHEWRRGRGSALLGWWWGLLLLHAGRVFFAEDGEDADLFGHLDEVRRNDIGALVGAGIGIVGIVLAIQVVRRLSDRQEQALLAQHAALAARPG